MLQGPKAKHCDTDLPHDRTWSRRACCAHGVRVVVPSNAVPKPVTEQRFTKIKRYQKPIYPHDQMVSILACCRDWFGIITLITDYLLLYAQQEASLPFLKAPHDALREGLTTLKDGVSSSHPVESIQKTHGLDGERSRLQMLQNVYGSALPARMHIEKQILSRWGVEHIGCICRPSRPIRRLIYL